jgi:gliding motility-associated-like protein
MNVKIVSLGILLAGLFFAIKTQAQLLPPNQPEQDACNALQLCGNTFFTPYSYQGNGTVNDLPATPCGGFGNPCGEDNVVWLRLVVNSPGSIVFTITPVVPQDDYDFAIVNVTGINCNNIASSNVIRCNFNNNMPVFNNGIVGLNTTSTITTVSGGSFGSPFLQQITAAAGDEYLIMINNFGSGGGPSSGFTIDFTGSTAQFFDNTPPHFNSIIAGSPCSYRNSVTIHLNTQVACNSIAANGSDFQLSPGGTISGATGINCNGVNGYTDDIVVNFSPALAPGNYTIKAKTGTDNNTLINLCGTSLSLPDSLNFVVAAAPVYSTASLVCTTLTVQTNVPVKCNSISPNGSDFSISGPAAAGITGATGIGCTANGYTSTISLTLSGPVTASGTYTITSQNGTDGNTLQDSCGVNQALNNTITFSALAPPELQLTDSLITCTNTGILLPLTVTNADPALTYTYQWTPAAGLSNPAIAQPLATPVADATYTVTVSSNNTTMCPSSKSVFVHSLQGFTLLTQDTTICEGASVEIRINGSDEYNYTWTPPAGVSNPNIKNPVITPDATTSYVLVASFPGCNDSIVNLKITVEPNPTNITVSADQFMCQYDTVVLSAIASPSSFNFSYTWTPSDDLLYATGPNTAFFGDTTTTLKVTASTPIGCTVTDSIKVTVFPGDFSALTMPDTGFCPGGSVQLGVLGGNAYHWTPAYGLSDTLVANPVASPQTSTTYHVVVTDKNGCKDTQKVKVSVYPSAVVTLPDSVNIYPGESYEMATRGNCLYYQWFPSSGLSADNIANPVAQPEVRTRYFLNARTERGCLVRDSIDVLVKPTEMAMPNAFTPGNDGINNEFKLSRRGIAKLNYFFIFNRWGQKVFESTNPDIGWNGKYKDQPQPMGVYIYVIDAVTDSGLPYRKQGNVTLIR